MKFNKGFSLLELILAVAIFSLGGVAMATLFIDSGISTKLSNERTEALFYAEEGVEAVLLIRDGSVWADLVDGEYGLDNSSGDWVFTAEPDLIESKYTRAVTLTASTTATSTIDVSVNVSWELSSAHIASTTLNTIITNWQAN